MHVNKEFDDGSRYEGFVNENGQRHGSGTVYWPTGNRFVAEWKEDYPITGTYYETTGYKYVGKVCYDKEKFEISGEGISYYSNGQIYVGTHLNGVPNCKGTFYYTNGNIEKGFFVNGNLSKGELILADKTKYKGNFYYVDSKLVFDGEVTDPFGLRYIGRCIDYMYEGYGKLYFNKFLRYDGNWKNKLMHGYGKFYYINGDIYEGEFENDLKHGKGTYTSNGYVASGKWVNGKKEGKFNFEYIFKNSKCTEIYENGKIVERRNIKEIDPNRKFEVLHLKDGSLYNGEVKKNKPNGVGVLYPNENNKEIHYGGIFINGKLNDNGFCYLEDYDYEGNFKNGKITGYGKMTHKDRAGITYAYFKNGIPRGFCQLNDEISSISLIEGFYTGTKFKGNVHIIYYDKREYFGEIKCFYPEGKGKMIYPNGSLIVGTFKKEEPHGEVRLFENGKTYDCVYKNGKCIGKKEYMIDINKKY